MRLWAAWTAPRSRWTTGSLRARPFTWGRRTCCIATSRPTSSAGLKENISTLTLWAVLFAIALGLTFLIPRTPVYPLLAVFAGTHLSGVLLGDWASFHYYPNTNWLALLATLLLLVSDLTLLGIPCASWRNGGATSGCSALRCCTW